MILQHFNKIILFGGGEELKFTSIYFAKKKIDTIIFTSPRQHNSEFERTIKDNKYIAYEVHKSIYKTNILELLNKYKCLGISFGSPWIFKSDIISKFNGSLLNLHSMVLPLFKGGASISWMIMSGTREGNCLIHQIDEGIDTGYVLYQKPFRYPENLKKPIEFQEYLNRKNILFLQEFFKKCEEGKDFSLSNFPSNHAIYFPRLHTQTHSFINWEWDTEEIYKFINSFDDPYDGATSFLNGEKVRIKDVAYEKNNFNVHPFMYGLAFRIINDNIYVFTKNGCIIINTIINSKEELINQTVKLGDRFFTPDMYLNEAKAKRVYYMSDKFIIKE